jgi:hypothetical protein
MLQLKAPLLRFARPPAFGDYVLAELECAVNEMNIPVASRSEKGLKRGKKLLLCSIGFNVGVE